MKLTALVGQANSGKDTVAGYFVNNHNFVQVALADPLKRLGSKVFEFTEEQLWGPSEYRNALDPRYKYFDKNRGSDAMWAKAAHNLGLYGRDWVKTVLSGHSKGEREDAHARLVQWFNWLGHNYPELSPRIMLQTLGTEWGREVVDEDIWVNYMLTAATVLSAHHPDMTYTRVGGFVPKKGANHGGVVVSDVRFNNELKAIKAFGGELIQVQRPATDAAATATGIAQHKSETEQQGFDSSKFDKVIKNDGTLEDLENAVDSYVQS